MNGSIQRERESRDRSSESHCDDWFRPVSGRFGRSEPEPASALPSRFTHRRKVPLCSGAVRWTTNKSTRIESWRFNQESPLEEKQTWLMVTPVRVGYTIHQAFTPTCLPACLHKQQQASHNHLPPFVCASKGRLVLTGPKWRVFFCFSLNRADEQLLHGATAVCVRREGRGDWQLIKALQTTC